MKKHPDGMRAEYDFSKGVRGKYYAKALEKETVLIKLDADILEKYKTAKSINKALREYAKAH